MAITSPLRRLLRILKLKEEQAQAALECALAQMRQLEDAFGVAVERELRGRRLVNASADSGEAVDRHAALEETAAGRRIAATLRTRIAQAELMATQLRDEFLARRVELRQAETLSNEAEIREATEEARRSQRSTDDWYLGRVQRDGACEVTNCESAPAGELE